MLTAASRISKTAAHAEAMLRERNSIYEKFFAAQALPLAEACRVLADRFSRGGRLLAFGRGAYATDAQHVSVEFTHPVIVGKRALPALDLSLVFRPWLEALVRPEDIVMGFGPPGGDTEVDSALEMAAARRAMTFALPGRMVAQASVCECTKPLDPQAEACATTLPRGSYSFNPATRDPFMHQEVMEILYHTLWESVHVFFERNERGHDAGAASFLYPFLGERKQDDKGVVEEVAASIKAKVEEDAKLRLQVADEESEAIARTVDAIRERISRGGKLILFGNGGSATDANDWAIDCVSPPDGSRPIPAVSLSLEPATVTAMANDVGVEVIFLRQLIAHAKPEDVAVGISTSGGSRNIVIALEEARKRNLLTIGLLGYDGGEISRRGLVDHALIVRSDYIPRIQEVQASIYHVIRELLGNDQD